MENFQLVVAILGAIAIIAVLVHGLWSIRKQRPRPLRDSPTAKVYKDKSNSKSLDRDGFDADGIGEVRVRKVHADDSDAESTPARPAKTQGHTPVQRVRPATASSDDVNLASEPSIKVSRERREPSMGQDKPQSHQSAGSASQSSHSTPPSKPLSAAPSAAELADAYQNNSYQDDFDTSFDDFDDEIIEDDAPLGDPVDVLVLHLVAKEGQVIHGAELLPCLLALNFKYGDMNIFHRHQDNAGNGKVLFSMANMLKPGIFDPDTMEQFSTHGVVLFMTLPCHGDALINFQIMLNSAEQMADDLDAQVLDGSRQPWDDYTKQAYIQRIRRQM